MRKENLEGVFLIAFLLSLPFASIKRNGFVPSRVLCAQKIMIIIQIHFSSAVKLISHFNLNYYDESESQSFTAHRFKSNKIHPRLAWRKITFIRIVWHVLCAPFWLLQLKLCRFAFGVYRALARLDNQKRARVGVVQVCVCVHLPLHSTYTFDKI